MGDMDFVEFLNVIVTGDEHYIRESLFIFGHMAGFFIAMKNRDAGTKNAVLYLTVITSLAYLLAHKTW